MFSPFQKQIEGGVAGVFKNVGQCEDDMERQRKRKRERMGGK